MRKLTALSLSTLLLTSTYITPVYADWGSLLNDLTEAGKSLLSDDTEPTVATETTALDYDTIVSGLKEALDIGTRQAIDSVSQQDGYLANELIRIAMPPEVQQAGDLVRQFGLGSLADSFEQSLNHAAEKAAPEATNIIIDAIKTMSIEDAHAILKGPDDAATQYFRNQTTTQLTELFKPSITDSLNQVGSTKYYNDLTDQIAAVPFVGETINLDLPDYVTEQALNGLFTMIAAEEKKIRDNPTARTTELLKHVFSI